MAGLLHRRVGRVPSRPGSRLRVDLAGVDSNALVVATCSGIYLATDYLPLLVFVVVAKLQMLYQFVPFVRMDGYWILSDLVGVPNLFAYVAPVFASRRRKKDPRQLARRSHSGLGHAG